MKNSELNPIRMFFILNSFQQDLSDWITNYDMYEQLLFCSAQTLPYLQRHLLCHTAQDYKRKDRSSLDLFTLECDRYRMHLTTTEEISFPKHRC